MSPTASASERASRRSAVGWPRRAEGPPGRTQHLAVITRVAARAFRTRGYHGVSVDEIAALLGITKRTLYQYVRSKEELLFACFSRGLDEIDHAMHAAEGSTDPARARLASVLRQYVRAVTSDYGWCMIHAEDQSLSPKHARLVTARKSAIDRGLRRIIEAGVADGSMVCGDPKLASFAIAGALNWIPQWYESGRGLTPEVIAHRLLHVFELGLQPRADD